jgi:hypothetical protein
MLDIRMCQDIIIGATFACLNVDSGCWTVMEKSNQNCENKKTFVAYSRDMWKQYPENVWQWYLEYVSKVETGQPH